VGDDAEAFFHQPCSKVAMEFGFKNRGGQATQEDGNGETKQEEKVQDFEEISFE